MRGWVRALVDRHAMVGPVERCAAVRKWSGLSAFADVVKGAVLSARCVLFSGQRESAAALNLENVSTSEAFWGSKYEK